MCLICYYNNLEPSIQNEFQFNNEISLDNCELISDLSPLLKNNRNIIKLTLTHLPQLSIIPDQLCYINELIIYDIPKITKLPIRMPNLFILKLIHSNIKSIPDSYHKLKQLYLQDTVITKLPLNLNRLEILQLNQTPIDFLPDYPKVYHLLLYRTKITNIPLSYQNHLTELNIGASRNASDEPHIRTLPKYLTNLKKLYATLSTIKEIPDTYVNLDTLLINQTDVRKLSPKFHNLEILDCSDTRIKTIPKEYVKLIELSYSEDKTTWDSSWYKDDDDMILVEKIQKWFFVKKYIKQLKTNRDIILKDYLLFIHNKYAIVLQKWLVKTIKYLKYIRSFKTNKKSIFNDYKLFYNFRLENINFLQYNLMQCLIYKFNIRFIRFHKNNIQNEYLKYSKNQIIKVNIIKKWYKKHKYIEEFCKSVKLARGSHMRSYKYYLKDKLKNNKLNSLVPSINVNIPIINDNKPFYFKNYDSGQLFNFTNKIIKFFKKVTVINTFSTFNNKFILIKLSKNSYKITTYKNYTSNIIFATDIKNINDLRKIIKKKGLNIKYNTIQSNIFNIIDVLSKITNLYYL